MEHREYSCEGSNKGGSRHKAEHYKERLLFFIRHFSKFSIAMLELRVWIRACQRFNYISKTFLKTLQTTQIAPQRQMKNSIQLKKLSLKKASGDDELPTTLLKDSALQIAKHLCYKISTSLREFFLKIPSTVLLYQSYNRMSEDMGNYRPLTVLFVGSKILGKVY